MRITDLLDARSISLDCSPKTEKLMTKKLTDVRFMQEKKKVQQE